mmetsp:Transcript_90031/g.275633  ORF Transcript_90031/g.275633 Transcript_90031/m.275633 type:complete len:238 (+) Transcript_90031:4476-5189(+)
MLLQDRRINALDDLRARREASHHGESPLQAGVGHERACFGVHASGEIYVDKVLLLLERLPVVHLRIRHHLREQHDGRLRVVGVDVRHVQVVNEKDTFFVPRRAIRPARTLVHRAHDNPLQSEGTGVVVVVDGLGHEVLVVRRQISQEVLHDRCLARARHTNIEHGLLPECVELQYVLHALEFHVADHDILEHALRHWLVRGDILFPADPILLAGFEAVIIAITRVGESDSLGDALHE